LKSNGNFSSSSAGAFSNIGICRKIQQRIVAKLLEKIALLNRQMDARIDERVSTLPGTKVTKYKLEKLSDYLRKEKKQSDYKEYMEFLDSLSDVNAEITRISWK
jgi:hypothetical protein